MPLDSSWNTPVVSPLEIERGTLPRSSSGTMRQIERVVLCDRGARSTSFCAMSITVSVFRPKKSNLTSPAASTSSLSY